jgi:hypothetical protein
VSTLLQPWFSFFFEGTFLVKGESFQFL